MVRVTIPLVAALPRLDSPTVFTLTFTGIIWRRRSANVRLTSTTRTQLHNLSSG